MSTDLMQLAVARRPSHLRFDGRVLFLVDDADLMRRQLAGEDLPFTSELRARLRDQISTDEITPAYICYYFDETLGDFPYLGLRAGGEFPVTRGSVRRGGFGCSVSGRRRGKGSSREQSPYAELMAGIRLVIAENIERIYNENCQNLGVLTSTDFGLIERIRSGEAIALAEFTADADQITRDVIEYGGLFEYNVARLQGKVSVPPVTSQREGGRRPMTIAEKIFAARWLVDAASGRCGVPWVQPGDSGFVRTDWRFSHEYVSPMAAIFFEHKLGEDARVHDPSSIIMFRDHLTYLHEVMPPERVQLGLLDVARQLKDKQEEFARKQGVIYYGERLGIRLGSEAICHSKMLESYAEPGQLIVGTDSHTPHSGAIGCIAFGIGTTAIFNAWITKDVRVSVPPSFKVVVHGRKPANVTAKDFMLEILRQPYIRDGQAIGQIIEYAGEAVAALSIDERATMTNMAAEVGAFTGIVAPDERAVDYLVTERGLTRARAEQLCEGFYSDPDADYVRVIEIDASALRPMVALPGDPGNGRYVDELGEEPVVIDVAYGGSCTAGKKEDMDMYAAVFADARVQGLRVPGHVQLFIQCGSQEVRQYCEQRGYLALFGEIGAEFIEPGCGACIAAGPGTSRTAAEVTISSQNRNFPGRSGPGQLYLASPYTVAASAIAGRIVEWQPGRPIEQLETAGG